MGCNDSAPNGMDFISSDWTVTAFHYIHMAAHNCPLFFHLMENVSLKPASWFWPRGVSWLRSEATCVLRGKGLPWPRQGGWRSGLGWTWDLCSFYFAAFCPETFCAQGQVVLIWPGRAVFHGLLWWPEMLVGMRRQVGAMWDGGTGPREAVRAWPFSVTKLLPLTLEHRDPKVNCWSHGQRSPSLPIAGSWNVPGLKRIWAAWYFNSGEPGGPFRHKICLSWGVDAGDSGFSLWTNPGGASEVSER